MAIGSGYEGWHHDREHRLLRLCAVVNGNWKDLRCNVVDADLMDVAYNVKEGDYALKHLDAYG